jgi:hypothetical protein
MLPLNAWRSITPPGKKLIHVYYARPSRCLHAVSSPIPASSKHNDPIAVSSVFIIAAQAIKGPAGDGDWHEKVLKKSRWTSSTLSRILRVARASSNAPNGCSAWRVLEPDRDRPTSSRLAAGQTQHFDIHRAIAPPRPPHAVLQLGDTHSLPRIRPLGRCARVPLLDWTKPPGPLQQNRTWLRIASTRTRRSAPTRPPTLCSHVLLGGLETPARAPIREARPLRCTPPPGRRPAAARDPRACLLLGR